MQKFKPLLIELIWLAIILNATVLVTIWIFGWTFLSNRFDIRLHETYFTISSWKIVLPLFVFVTFFIYFIKEVKNQFQRKASNIIIMVTGLVLILLIATINKQVIITEMIYFSDAIVPSLSAMNEMHLKKAISPAVHVVSNTLTVIQFFVTLSLLYVSFKMGRNYVAKPVRIVNHNHPIPHTNGSMKPKAIPQAKPKPEVGSSK